MRRAVLYCTYHTALYRSLTIVRDAIDLLRRVALTFEFFLVRFSPLPARMRRTARTLQSTQRMHVSILLYRYYILPDTMWLPLQYKASPNVDEGKTKKNSKRSNRFRRYSRWRSDPSSLSFTSHPRVKANILRSKS